jgi:hypothetical protein
MSAADLPGLRPVRREAAVLPGVRRTLDVVVGIDPGIRNAGFVWVGFDRDLVAYVFDEGCCRTRLRWITSRS